jgi:hypothetical protein
MRRFVPNSLPGALLGAFMLTGCVATAPAPTSGVDLYSQQENNHLTYCVGLTDSAWSIATMKLAGKTRDQVRQFYARHPNQKLITAEIDKVYSGTFTRAWDYSVQFFRDCAVHVGNVAPGATDTAAYCMQNAMLSGVAQEYKAAGKSQQQAYAGLPIQGDTPKSLVETVYANQDDRSGAMLRAWNSCIGTVTDR